MTDAPHNDTSLLMMGAVHDLNNALTTILGYSDLALEAIPSTHAAHEHLKIIHESSEKAAFLMQQLLELARKVSFKKEAIDLNAMIVDRQAMLQRLLQRHLTLHCSLRATRAIVLGDLLQMEQIVLNLVMNAKDAMTQGEIWVETYNTTLNDAQAQNKNVEPGEFIIISVRDLGKGMTDAVRMRVFEPFFTTKEIGKGIGLGMAAVHEIIEQAQGFIEVDSVLDQGTTFKVYLPISCSEV